MKKFMIMAVAFIIGLLLWVLCTPYAKAHRDDPTLTGGEAMFPIATLAIGAMICSKVKTEKKNKVTVKQWFYEWMDKLLYKPALVSVERPKMHNFVIRNDNKSNKT